MTELNLQDWLAAIFDEAGNITISGSALDDALNGGETSENISGVDGNDRVVLSVGGSAFSETGNDPLIGTAGDDALYGDDGNDLLYGKEGNDRLRGSAGDDVLDGGAGDDVLIGGEGHDHLNGGAGEDRLYGGAGKDILVGGEGNDRLLGHAGDDVLDGGTGDDGLYGDDGNDILIGGSGSDWIVGGGGTDTAIMNGRMADHDIDIKHSVTTISVGQDINTLKGVEFVLFDDSVLNLAAEFGEKVDPLAFDDHLSVDENKAVQANVLVNDFDDGELTLVSAGGAANGLVSIGEAGLLQYTPDADFFGADQFTYTAIDGDGNTAEATVHVEVNFVNEAPIAADDSFSIVSGVGAAEGNLLDNDSDADGHELSVIAANGVTASGGQYAIDADGNFSYTEAEEFVGTEHITYTVADELGTETVGNIAVTVESAPLPDPSEDPEYTAPAVASERALAEFASRFVAPPAHHVSTGDNVLYGSAGNDVLYGNDGNDRLRGGAGDDVLYGGGGDDVLFGDDGNDRLFGGDGDDRLYGGTGDDILVGGAGNGRLLGGAGDDTLYGGDADDALYGGNGNDILIGGSGSDWIVGGDGTDIAIMNGRMADHDIDIKHSVATISIGEDINTLKGVEFVVFDDGMLNLAAERGVKVDPLAFDDHLSVDENKAVQTNVLVNDFDDGELTLVSASGAANGSVSIGEDGMVQYTPDADFFGMDRFTYTATDGDGNTTEATVQVQVNFVNEVPVAADDNFSIVSGVGAVEGNLLDNDSDGDGHELSTVAADGVTASGGQYAIGADGSFSYVEADGFVGTEHLTYTVVDQDGAETVGTIAITVEAASSSEPSQEPDVPDAAPADDDLPTEEPGPAVEIGETPERPVLSAHDGHKWTVNDVFELESAIEQASDGDVIQIRGGDYNLADDLTSYRGALQQGGFQVDKSLKFVGIEGTPVFHNTNDDGSPGTVTKGLFTIKASDQHVAFENIRFEGATNTDRNAAGIRLQGGDLTVENSTFEGNQNGILGAEAIGFKGDVIIENSEFIGNGSDGYSHGVYIGSDNLYINGSTFADTKVGHHVKSVSTGSTVVLNSVIDDGDRSDAASRAIDVTAGGDVWIEGNQVTKGAGAQTGHIFYYNVGRGEDTGELVVKNNSFDASDYAGNATVAVNAGDTVLQFRGNELTGVVEGRVTSGLADEVGTILDGIAMAIKMHDDGAVDYSNDANTIILDDSAGYKASTQPISGNDGDDLIVASDSEFNYDTFFGGAGNDTMAGHRGNDALYGGEGDDIITGGDFDDFLAGNEGNDTLYGDEGNDKLYGGAGNDVLLGGDGKDILVGSDGNDIIISGEGNLERLSGGGGNDILIGGQGRDFMQGGDGDDILYGGTEDDGFLGGDGTDTAVYDLSFGEVVMEKAPDWAGPLGHYVKAVDRSSPPDSFSKYGEKLVEIEHVQFRDGVFNTETGTFNAGETRVDIDALLALEGDYMAARPDLTGGTPNVDATTGMPLDGDFSPLSSDEVFGFN